MVRAVLTPSRASKSVGRWGKIWPHLSIAGAVLYLTAAWSGFLLVDVNNCLGMRDYLAERIPVPLTWFFLFEEGGSTEIAQWLMLSLTVVAACLLAGRLFAAQRRPPAFFWMLMGITRH